MYYTHALCWTFVSSTDLSFIMGLLIRCHIISKLRCSPSFNAIFSVCCFVMYIVFKWHWSGLALSTISTLCAGNCWTGWWGKYKCQWRFIGNLYDETPKLRTLQRSLGLRQVCTVRQSNIVQGWSSRVENCKSYFKHRTLFNASVDIIPHKILHKL